MEIVAKYKTRVLADDDRNFLMSHGIPSVVYGESGLQALKKHFGSELIAISVKEEHADKATALLKQKRNKPKPEKFI